MKVYVNNREITTSATSLEQLAQELTLPERGVAIGVEGKIVPRTAWADCMLFEGAGIIIVKAACGG